MVTSPGNPQYHVRDRSLQVVVRAEGPTCVLTVADLQVTTNLLIINGTNRGCSAIPAASSLCWLAHVHANKGFLHV